MSKLKNIIVVIFLAMMFLILNASIVKAQSWIPESRVDFTDGNGTLIVNLPLHDQYYTEPFYMNLGDLWNVNIIDDGRKQ